ncbi:hypothetical protein ACHAXA_008763 [Cyclostephanos tholiformis]|uniref:Major facilitator superfamily (MFS) profile domain-containing protein n=1 Tax=Cyclostephanos tholiformis TaxID=382380 RepID=A0ABD3RDL1_9STRA
MEVDRQDSRSEGLLEGDGGCHHRGTSSSSASTPLPAPRNTMQAIAGVMGNVLEYDFALFGYFSDVIATVFFPPPSDDDGGGGGDGHGDDVVSSSRLVASFTVYGGAFVVRPVGGLIIGHIGDRHGRKRALVLSLALMAFPTFLMGCLPTYEQIGPTSTILLVICRLLQGVSVGGQLPASLIYTVEMSPKEHWGYYGSLTANIGTLLGSFVGVFIRALLTDEQLIKWGWRLPFLSGIFIGFVSMYLETHGREHNPNVSDDDKNDLIAEKGGLKHPLGDVFKRENLPALASATLTPMLYGAGFYTTFVWMAIFMKVLVDPPIEHGRYLLLACSRIDGDAKKRWWLVVWASGYLDLS